MPEAGERTRRRPLVDPDAPGITTDAPGITTDTPGITTDAPRATTDARPDSHATPKPGLGDARAISGTVAANRPGRVE